MKSNPRNTGYSQSHCWPVACERTEGHVPSHHLFMSHLLTVELELPLPVSAKPWKSTAALQVFQEDCVTSWIVLNRLGTVVQKRHLIWETGRCHPQLLLLPCCLSLPPGADLCVQWACHGWGVTLSCSWLSEVCSSFMHSFVSFMSLPCHCLLAFLHLMRFFAFYCY